MRHFLARAALAAALAATLTAIALAQAPKAGDKPSFEALDRNSDGRVSLNEAAEHDALFVAFKSLDKDKDGLLTREELAAFQREKPGA